MAEQPILYQLPACGASDSRPLAKPRAEESTRTHGKHARLTCDDRVTHLKELVRVSQPPLFGGPLLML
ncbi:MAG: hypothetical protein KA712_17015 [Myxococcales bacterium]|nr:hypothetical protein [Myxococcales bacterium]